MSRRRWLSTDISKDARVRRLAADCGEFAALVYSWAIPHAADDGSLPADPDELLMLVVPGFRWRTTEDMQAAIDGMLRLGLLEQDGEKLAFPPAAFFKYQTYVTAERRETAQINAEQRVSARNHADQRETAPSSSLGLSLSSGSGASAPTARGRARGIDPSRLCPACHLRRRGKVGVCIDCHGQAIVAARQANVDIAHISLVELVALATQPGRDLPNHDGNHDKERSDRTAAHSRGTRGSDDAPAA